MKKVFIVNVWNVYEEWEMLGVFTTIEKAITAGAEYAKNRMDREDLMMWFADDFENKEPFDKWVYNQVADENFENIYIKEMELDKIYTE